MKREINYFPKVGSIINVIFRPGNEGKIVGQLYKKICLIVETIPGVELPKKRELWKCRVVAVFPQVIDVCPIEMIVKLGKSKKKKYHPAPKVEIPKPKKRQRIKAGWSTEKILGIKPFE